MHHLDQNACNMSREIYLLQYQTKATTTTETKKHNARCNIRKKN